MIILRIVVGVLLAVAIVAMLVLSAVRSGSNPDTPGPAPTGVTVIGPCLPKCGNVEQR